MSDWKEALFESRNNDITSVTYEIITKAREEYDKFIFETLRPYCEETVKMEISKKDLEDALTMWKNRNEEHKTYKWHNYRCPECKQLCTYFLNGEYVLVKRPNHCPYCGVKMEVEDGKKL